jgi:uncharacterized protein YjeT (DUF2065 family)
MPTAGLALALVVVVAVVAMAWPQEQRETASEVMTQPERPAVRLGCAVQQQQRR